MQYVTGKAEDLCGDKVKKGFVVNRGKPSFTIIGNALQTQLIMMTSWQNMLSTTVESTDNTRIHAPLELVLNLTSHFELHMFHLLAISLDIVSALV